MILSLLALAAVQASVPSATPPASQSDEALLRRCLATVRSNPEQGVEIANDWRISGGGIGARQCLGLAYVALERWVPAAVTFEQAARDAETGQDPRRADFWVQSGNAWLAADDGAKARTAFDAALATTLLAPQLRGEVHLDRARAGVVLGDLAGARADLDKGLELVPADPFAWLLSAALARRQQLLPRAQADIAKALELAPDDPDVLLEAGTIAGAAKDFDGARTLYGRAAQAAPTSPAGAAARAALAGIDEPKDATP